jgi:cytoskeleton protein RodZ
MADIGSLLRDTRMRERIDITTVESATKIRAKYLRALENEEWDQLPGPTFVRTFLRTYAEYLGLDPKMLVEEYRQRFERPGPQDVVPFSTRAGGGRRPPRAPRGIPPWAVLGVAVLILVGVLFALGSLGDNSNDVNVEPTPTATVKPATKRAKARRRHRATPAKPKVISLKLVPEGTVYVCLENAAGDKLIAGANLTKPTKTYRSKRMRVTFGNGLVKMRVNGKSYGVPDTSDAVGYALNPGAKPKRLTDHLPSCA